MVEMSNASRNVTSGTCISWWDVIPAPLRALRTTDQSTGSALQPPCSEKQGQIRLPQAAAPQHEGLTEAPHSLGHPGLMEDLTAPVLSWKALERGMG